VLTDAVLDGGEISGGINLCSLLAQSSGKIFFLLFHLVKPEDLA
jgi:hypothetical protein